ncbi:MAG: hypothetical protein WB791_07610, partial [Waddliaceae bacterium]
LAYPQKTFKSDLIKAFRYKAMEFLLSIFLQKKYFVEFHALSIPTGTAVMLPVLKRLFFALFSKIVYFQFPMNLLLYCFFVI